MLKGFVSGEEKDIVRIPMKRQNLLDYNVLFGDNPDRTSTYFIYYKIVLEPNTQYTMTTNVPNYFMNQCPYMFGTKNVMAAANDSVYSNEPKTITSNSDGSVFIACRVIPNTIPERYIQKQDFDNGTYYIMLNAGSQALPYEPYGYQEGWEVRDNQDRLIWGREDELQTATGTLPFKGYSLPVKVKSLLGNAVQNGTPAPDNIVTPEMCGVRTGNLIDVNASEAGGITDTGVLVDNPNAWRSTVYYDIDATLNYVASKAKQTIRINYYDASKNHISREAVTLDTYKQLTVPSNARYFKWTLYDNNGIPDIQAARSIKPMVNAGTTPIPYELYGWKIPFENHGENLFDPSTATLGKYINSQGAETNSISPTPVQSLNHTDYIEIQPNTDYTYHYKYRYGVRNTIALCWFDASKTLISRDTKNIVEQDNEYTLTGTSPVNAAFCIINFAGYLPNESMELSFNFGSTPKPYSPYLNETIPVYLGEVPTVRRIKKVVFTGQETWTEVYPGEPEAQAQGIVMYATSLSEIGTDRNDFRCSHFFVGNYRGYLIPGQGRINGTSPEGFNVNYNNGSGGLQNFKAWLASEYAAGHPVTLWYALATEQTSVVNEPLCKISTYADELTTIQVHGLSAPLYGIGDYKDALNLSTGVVTRKVKMWVLTGDEDWSYIAGVTSYGAYYRFKVGSLSSVAQGAGEICTNYRWKNISSSTTDIGFSMQNSTGYNGAFAAFRPYAISAESELATWKAYLAAQYQAGTPVTIWYILSTPTTETVTVPTGMTGEIEGYLTQISTPTPTNRSVPKWNGVEETGGTYAVTVYTPPEIPTTTGQNTLTVETSLAPSKLEASIHAKKIHYGFKIDKSNDDSETAVIYTHDAVTMTPAHMDFTNDRFDYGSWGNAFFVRDCYPVALNLDGTIAYRLDPDDYTKKTDGTASDIFYELLTTAPSDWSTQWKQYYTKSGDEYVLNSQDSAPTFATDTYYKLTYNSSFTGNFMMAFPKVWFYRHEDSQYNYIEISNHKLSNDWKCYAHINASGQEVDFIYLPLFKGVIVNSKLRSIPGVIPQGNTTATDEVNAATALGSRWQIWDHSSVECLNDLLTLMSKSIDSQGRYGAGRSNAYNASDTVTYGKLQSGTLIKKGKFHGYSSGYNDVKVFGIESLWANRYDRIQGLLLANGVWKVKMTPPYNFTGTDFVTLSSTSVPTDAGYLSRVQTSEYGSIPAATISTSGKYFKDFFYRYSNDTCVPLRGGNCGDTDIAGYRFIYAGDPASRTVWSFGASPVYK